MYHDCGVRQSRSSIRVCHCYAAQAFKFQLRNRYFRRSTVRVCLLSFDLFWTSDLWMHQWGNIEFFRFPSAVIALIFIARNIQPSLSLVDHGVEPCVLPRNIRSPLVGHYYCFIFLRGKIPVRVVTAPRFELTFQRQKISRLPTEPPW